MKHIPQMNLNASNDPLAAEVLQKLSTMIQHSEFVGGKEIECFEQEFADYCGLPFAVGCSNGTDAIAVALKALGIGPGMVVLVPANTFIATAEAVSMVGATVEFVDVEEGTLTLDPQAVRKHLHERKSPKPVRAMIPVHLYGQMADMPSLMKIAAEFDLKVVEDSAQAHGSLLHGFGPGHYGDAATFSFYPGKNLGAFGDAGAVITKDANLAQHIKKLTNHGRLLAKYSHELEGFNMRIDAFQAAILRIKLRHLAVWTQERRAKVNLYRELLVPQGIRLVDVRSGAEPVYHLLVMRSAQRDRLRESLETRGVHTAIHYPIPLPFLEAYQNLGYTKGCVPVCEQAANEVLSLPLWPELETSDIHYVCTQIAECVEQLGS